MVWEDHQILAHGLDVGPQDRVLSIGSAGCNVFNLLLSSPSRMDVLDVNSAQIDLIKIKIQAIQTLSHEDYLDLLFRDGISRGLAFCGRLDQAFSSFRKKILPAFWSPSVLSDLARCKILDEQREIIYRTNLEGLRGAIEVAFGKAALSQMRSQAQMAFVTNPNPGRDLFNRFIRLADSSLLKENFYMWLFLTGGLVEEKFRPPSLQAKNHQTLRQRVSRLELHSTDIESFLFANKVTYDKMNLSDIFEYMSDEKAQSLFSLISSRLTPGGRIAFWNLFVPREPKLESLNLKTRTSDVDSVCFYESFKVAEKSSS